MGIVHFYCRGDCKDYTPHSIVDQLSEGQKTFTKLCCVHEDADPFIIEHEKGKPPTQYSKRVELNNYEE